MPYHAIPYHTIPYHAIPCHTIPYHTIPYHTKSNQIKPNQTTTAACISFQTFLLLYWMTRGFGGAGGERDPAPSAIVPERRYITVRWRDRMGKKGGWELLLSENPKPMPNTLECLEYEYPWTIGEARSKPRETGMGPYSGWCVDAIRVSNEVRPGGGRDGGAGRGRPCEWREARKCRAWAWHICTLAEARSDVVSSRFSE